MPLHLRPTFRDSLAAASRPLVGMWACSGSSVLAEVDAGSGLDWLLIDMEHGPNTVESVLVQLQVVAGYPITPVVRVPANDPVIIKQVLDIGAQNIIVPMVDTADQARAAAAATRYPPEGIRGVGSALARSARWNRVPDYLADGSSHVSLTVQIESDRGVAAATEIAAVDGVDQVFVGPADLSASMGLLGQQTHPEVVDAVHRTCAAVRAAGKKAGVNAFDPAAADDYLARGIDFIAVGADVAMLARASDALAGRFLPAGDAG